MWVDGRLVDEETALKDGDRIEVSTALGAGREDGLAISAADVETTIRPARRLWLRVMARLHEWATDLWPTQLNLSWISGNLAVGGSFARKDIPLLAAQGLTAILDLRAEAQDDAEALGQHGIQLRCLPAPDREAPSPDEMVAAVRWVLDHLDRGGKVFVHCEHGVGRGPLLGCAVLVAQGYSAPEALRLVRIRRWQAAPNDRQLEALLAFEKLWRTTDPGQRDTQGQRRS